VIGLSPQPAQFRLAAPSDALAIAQLVNSAYRGDASRAGWTTEADLLGGQRTDPGAIRDFLRAAEGMQRVMPVLVDAQDAGETVDFPYDDIRCGEPRRPDLVLSVLRKAL
jgi:hypothetical protein